MALVNRQTDQDDEIPKMRMDVVKLVLPYLRDLDSKWKKVSMRSFNKNKLKAHESLYESLRHALS